MSILRVRLENGILTENYKSGMQKILPLPIRYGSDYDVKKEREFFAYLTTLGGGLVNGDEYFQCFELKNTKGAIRSQSNQKVYKGKSKLKTKLFVDDASVLVFHNDANIFYPCSDFYSQTKVFTNKNAKLFYLDGGYIGYANGEFSANMNFRLYVDGKINLNDTFCYNYNRNNLNCLLKHEYFYTVFIRDNISLPDIQTEKLKAHTSVMGENIIVRIASDDNDIAISYIEKIKKEFLQNNKMTLLSIS